MSDFVSKVMPFAMLFCAAWGIFWVAVALVDMVTR
jgi:hypothetical protein